MAICFPSIAIRKILCFFKLLCYFFTILVGLEPELIIYNFLNRTHLLWMIIKNGESMDNVSETSQEKNQGPVKNRSRLHGPEAVMIPAKNG